MLSKRRLKKLLDAGFINPSLTALGEPRKLNEATRKDHFPLPFMDQMLERLAGNEYYCFLDGFSGYFQIPIDPKDQEKTTFTCPYGTFAYRRMPFGLCNAPGTFQRCMMAIFHDMIEKTMEVFMDDFSVFGDSFSTCLTHLEKMLKRCEDTNLSLNWEKSHFMVKEGIVLGHKISKSGLEVDRAKVEVIAKLPHPTSVKGLFQNCPYMDSFLEKRSPFVISEVCIGSFNTLKRKMTGAPILIAPMGLPLKLCIHIAVEFLYLRKFRSYLVMSKSIVIYDHLHQVSLAKIAMLRLDSMRNLPDCEDSHTCSIPQRVSHPQLQFGNPVSKSID
ncbi:reverse transcriptase domain-containing protein [Tanacetum coccineum]